ncbi:MAG: hypothetical protein GJ676_20440 [Rhodobacteraceae bacterium]|nr:hypothetical protein [Paracoccaceae bacterium]
MPKFNTLITAAVLGILPGLAFGFQAWNRHDVNAVQGGVFEVVSEVGSAPIDYWCAAGDYAIRVLRTSAVQRVYIWQPIGPAVTRQGRKGVQFSLTPPPGADTSTSYSVGVKRAGDNMRASSAQNYCYDRVESEMWRAG